MIRQNQVIDAEYEIIKPRRSAGKVIGYYASMLFLIFPVVCSMIAMAAGIMWIAMLVYTFFWSLLGALVCIVGGFVMFVWAGAMGNGLTKRWNAR
jgi:hypothetical protein